MLTTAVCSVLLLTASAQSPDLAVRRILASAEFTRAAAFSERDYDRFVRELISLTEIPAPSSKEQRRGRAFVEMLRQQGLSDVEMDAERQHDGRPQRRGSGPMVAVVAHLDAVFPEGTDVKLKRDGTMIAKIAKIEDCQHCP